MFLFVLGFVAIAGDVQAAGMAGNERRDATCLRSGRAGCLPESDWSPSLRELEPLRVCREGTNLVVTTREGPGWTSGVYVVPSHSSYLPVEAPGRRFRWVEARGAFEFLFVQHPYSPPTFDR